MALQGRPPALRTTASVQATPPYVTEFIVVLLRSTPIPIPTAVGVPTGVCVHEIDDALATPAEDTASKRAAIFYYAACL
jgi:hypothetical protein